MKKTKQIRNIVVVSDLHCGCRMGLCPKSGAVITGADPGGDLTVMPSKLQSVVWGWWEEFWGDWVPKYTHKEPYDVVLNGDVIDGSHHNSTTQISQNIQDQVKLAVSIMRPVVDKCKRRGGEFFSVRGTAAHVGESSIHEEQVAMELGAKPAGGVYSRFELWKKLGSHLIHFLHHIGTTGSSAHESSAVNAEMAAEFVEAARWGVKPPSVIVRSHRHSAIEVRIPTKWGYATSVVTPSWQLKTPYVYRIASARLRPPQIGGLVIRLDDMGAVYTNLFVKHLQRDGIEE